MATWGGKVASGSFDKTIRVWDVGAGTHEQTLAGHEGSVFCPGGVRAAADQLLYGQDGEGRVDSDVGMHANGADLRSRVGSVHLQPSSERVDAGGRVLEQSVLGH